MKDDLPRDTGRTPPTAGLGRVRILLADDHALVREGLAAILACEPGFQVVEQASDGREAVSKAERLEPDIVLLDLTMPLLNGVEAARHILQKNPRARILVLSMHEELEYAAKALESGASGYVRKSSPPEELVEAIHRVLQGEIYLDRGIAAGLFKEYVQGLAAARKNNPLTPRQVEVLQLIAEGHTSKEIASLLKISIKTVESLRMQIMSRLGIHSIAGLTRYAVRQGLTAP